MAISLLSASSSVSSVSFSPASSEASNSIRLKHYNHGVAGFGNLSFHADRKHVPGLRLRSLPLIQKQSLIRSIRFHCASVVCAAALNARCSAEQTQTVEKPVSVISNAPVHNKSPELDDGGTGFPPRDDDGDGGGGGGGGGNFSGGFFFFGFLAFLGFLKDKESEGPYDSRRKY